LYLYIKTAERAHSPKNLWEKVKLPQNFAQALKMVDRHLLFWPQLYINKCKQRVTRIHQYLIRMRKLKLKVQPKIVGKIKKVERRETNREAKALKAAKLADQIKNELLERLHQGTYGDIYNFPQKEYDEVLDIEDQEEVEDEVEEEGSGEVEYVEEYDSDIMSDGDIEEDLADFGSDFELRSEEDTNSSGESSAEEGRDEDILAAAREKAARYLKNRRHKKGVLDLL
jgi:protein MAK16